MRRSLQLLASQQRIIHELKEMMEDAVFLGRTTNDIIAQQRLRKWDYNNFHTRKGLQ